MADALSGMTPTAAASTSVARESASGDAGCMGASIVFRHDLDVFAPVASMDLVLDAEIRKARRIGHQRHYQANAASPRYSELRSIVLKTVGLAEPLRDALKPLSSAIRAAFVYGSVAKATDQSASDIDLTIISDSLTYAEVFGALERSRALWFGRSTRPCTRPPSFQSAPGRKTRS
jgi:predicted nucleotidyltransferase